MGSASICVAEEHPSTSQESWVNIATTSTKGPVPGSWNRPSLGFANTVNFIRDCVIGHSFMQFDESSVERCTHITMRLKCPMASDMAACQPRNIFNLVCLKQPCLPISKVPCCFQTEISGASIVASTYLA